MTFLFLITNSIYYNIYHDRAGFVCSILLFTSYLQDAFGINVRGTLTTRSPRLSLWSSNLATVLVVMGASANFYDGACGLGNNVTCNRAVYGIVYGALATLAAVAIVGMKIATGRAPFAFEICFSFFLVILSGVGVALITSQSGPGAELGNLYYFTWASFLTSFMLLASCVEDYKSASFSSTAGEDVSDGEHAVIHHSSSGEP